MESEFQNPRNNQKKVRNSNEPRKFRLKKYPTHHNIIML